MCHGGSVIHRDADGTGRLFVDSETDYDDDGRQDLFIANDAQANTLFHNEGHGRFAEVGYEAGVAARAAAEASP